MIKYTNDPFKNPMVVNSIRLVFTDKADCVIANYKVSRYKLITKQLVAKSVIGELIITSDPHGDLDSEVVPKFVLSAYLLALWGFEQKIVDAQLIDELPSQKSISLTVIHIIVEHVFCNNAFNFNLEEFDFIDDLALFPDIEQWWLSNK